MPRRFWTSLSLYLFALYQRFQLFVISSDFMREVAQAQPNLEDVRGLMDRFLRFRNQFWFNDVTRKVYAKLSNVSIEITGLSIKMLGSTGAFVTCKWKQSQENNGKLETSSGRMTLVYQLIAKEWKIVHRHTSPDNPDATRPVFPSERQPVTP